MHKAAYHALGLQHSYQVFETTSLESLDEIARAPDFGGASISLPFKTSIMASIDFKSTHATAIGAINTLLPIRDPLEVESGVLGYQASQRNQAGPVIGWYGDNTDWSGILECVQRNLSPRNTIRPWKTTALVIGAGGAARAAVYALIKMGCRKIAIFNRTVEHAEQVATHFNVWMEHNFNVSDPITVIQSISEDWPAHLQPATVIVSCIPAHGIGGNRPAELTIPDNWLQSKSGGVVADVSTSKPAWTNYTNILFSCQLAYRPLETPLLNQIRKLRSRSSIPWNTVDGLEMLTIQAMHQFELMTGRKAPRAVMKSQVYSR
jgi:shikimate 5-dehydrogenase